MSHGPKATPASCIMCGKCLEVCPLLAATGREELSPRAKALLASSMENAPDSLPEKDSSALASLCLGCGRCKESCSQGVDVPEAVSRLRASHPGWKQWLWKQWLTRSDPLWPAAGKLAAKLPENLGPKNLPALLKAARSLGREPMAPFVSITALAPAPRTEALLFPGCAASSAAPYWTNTAKALCAKLNISLIEAEFGCCGASLRGAGLRREEQATARRNLEIWRAGNRPMLLTFCASCHAGLLEYAQDSTLFPDQEEARTWEAALTPLADLLQSRLFHSGRFVLSPDAPQEVRYHRPCHTHGPDPDEALVKGLLGKKQFAISDACCGFGGILQLSTPQLAKKVADRCWKEMHPPPGTAVLTGCSACVFQLAATAPSSVQAAHWLECLKVTSS